MAKVSKLELILQITTDPSEAMGLTNKTIAQLEKLLSEKQTARKWELIRMITDQDHQIAELMELSIPTLESIASLKPVMGSSDNGSNDGDSTDGKVYTTLFPNERNNATQTERDLRAQLNKLSRGKECKTTMVKTLRGMLQFNAFTRDGSFRKEENASHWKRGLYSSKGNRYVPANLSVTYSPDFKLATIKYVK